MTAEPQGDDFSRAVDGWVQESLARGVRSFAGLVRSLPGVYPTEVVSSLTRQGLELPHGLPAPPGAILPLAGWPVEHPLDFDWRFTLETAKLLLDRCGFDGSVAFLGAPSLAREAALGNRRGDIALFDGNPTIIATVREALPWVKVQCVDLFKGEPVEVGAGTVALADPPWYPEYTVAFLWAAARLTRIGGRVLLSLPPLGTRPGVLAEREAVLDRSATFGLRLISVASGLLRYSMPPFERNALVAAGVPTIPDDWRCGDLLEFVVAERTSSERPLPNGTPDAWEEEAVGAVRIKCRARSDREFWDPTLSSVVDGDILETVSRRHPARAAADVWTSGNRIFRCAGSTLFRVIVSTLKHGGDAVGAVSAVVGRDLLPAEAAQVHQAATQAADLIRREQRELADYGYQHHECNLAEVV